MDYKFLLECKNDLFSFLSSMLTMPIYSGIRGMYEYSIKMHNTLDEKCKLNNKLANPGIVAIFKLCLNDITSLNNYEIENIYNDIKQQSGCYNYFDDLVKACFKSYILLLTYNPITENSNFSSPELYENINVKDFIHKCYIEVSNYFKENHELIFKDRKKDIYNIIKECIEHSIKKSISNYDEIIREYLKIKFDISKKEDKMSYDNIKSMVSKMIDTHKYARGAIDAKGGAEIMGVLESSANNVSSFNNVEHFINANKELEAIAKGGYVEDVGREGNIKKEGDGDSAQQLSGKNYLLNTQSNEHSTTLQLHGGVKDNTSNIINVGINKDIEIDNILNNKLLPINEDDSVNMNEKERDRAITKRDSVKGGDNIKDFSVTSTDINGALDSNVNDSTINNETTELALTHKTSLLESPMPIRNNKINDILPLVKKGRPSKKKAADNFFNNLV